MASIPASAIVNVTPSVLSTGGSALDLSGLVLTRSNRVPIGQTRAFSTALAVTAFFGALTVESALATRYFDGFAGSTIRPANMLFVQYPETPVSAYLRGRGLSPMTLAQLQALTGVLTLDVDGVSVTSATINLSAAASFSAAAALIQTGLNYSDVTFTGSIATTVLTVTAVASGQVAIGQVVTGGGVTPGTTIAAFLTGTGGVGTYTVSASQTVASTTLKSGQLTVAYDSVSGAFVLTGGTPGAGHTITTATGTLALPLGLASTSGATLSQGSAAGVPATAMDAVIAQTQNFASFMTSYLPTTAEKVAFAAWNSLQKNRFLYAMADDDISVTTASNSTSAGYAIITAGYSGAMPIYDPVSATALAAFAMGSIASIDFDRTEGRTNLAFLRQSGIVPGVTNRTIGDQLIANGYNFYGSYATANDEFEFLYPGRITGPFLWADSYVNQIWLNNAFQLALMSLLTQVRSIPYNLAGHALIESALMGAINDALDFGAIRSGVQLSATQITQLNNFAGRDIATTVNQRGWFLLIEPASPAVRSARGSPPITFWYADGQSVQSINLNSVQVQ